MYKAFLGLVTLRAGDDGDLSDVELFVLYGLNKSKLITPVANLSVSISTHSMTSNTGISLVL